MNKRTREVVALKEITGAGLRQGPLGVTASHGGKEFWLYQGKAIPKQVKDEKPPWPERPAPERKTVAFKGKPEVSPIYDAATDGTITVWFRTAPDTPCRSAAYKVAPEPVVLSRCGLLPDGRVYASTVPASLGAEHAGRPAVVLQVVERVPGASDQATAKQAYRLHTEGDRLYLTAATDLGLTNAVWGFLEDHLGCRFSSYAARPFSKYLGPKFEVLPQQRRLRLGKLDDLQEPAFQLRGFAYYLSLGEWLLKNRGGGPPVALHGGAVVGEGRAINERDGAELIWIPAGGFPRGSKRDDGSADERPQRKTHLDGFWIYKLPITVQQFKTFCEKSGREMPPLAWGQGMHVDPQADEGSYPMLVNWCDADAYARWASPAAPPAWPCRPTCATG